MDLEATSAKAATNISTSPDKRDSPAPSIDEGNQTKNTGQKVTDGHLSRRQKKKLRKTLKINKWKGGITSMQKKHETINSSMQAGNQADICKASTEKGPLNYPIFQMRNSTTPEVSHMNNCQEIPRQKCPNEKHMEGQHKGNSLHCNTHTSLNPHAK